MGLVELPRENLSLWFIRPAHSIGISQLAHAPHYATAS
jgi:hypothetical protein